MPGTVLGANKQVIQQDNSLCRYEVYMLMQKTNIMTIMSEVIQALGKTRVG